MEKKTSAVFMSCIVDGVYKEFQIDARQIDSLKVFLQKESGVLPNKRKERENITNLKQKKFLYAVSLGNYLDLEEYYDPENEEFNLFLKKFLSKLNLNASFEIAMNNLHEWFYFMSRYARTGKNEEYKKQDEFVSLGIKNTEYLNKLGIQVKDNHFIVPESLETRKEIGNSEDIKLYVKSGQKRA